MEYILSFADKSIDEILTELNQLSDDYTTLVFSDINETTDFSMLIRAVCAIPHPVESLDLSDNELGKRTTPELEQLFAAMSPALNKLDLSNNGLNQIALPVESLPAGLTWLGLSYNEYNQHDDFSVMIPKLPKKLETLEMHGNSLEDLDYPVLKTLCDDIKEKIPSLKTIISGSFSINPQCFNEIFYAVTFKQIKTPLAQNPIAIAAAHTFGIFANKLQESHTVICAAITSLVASAETELVQYR